MQAPQKKIALKEGIRMWENQTGQKVAESTEVKLNGWIPPIEKIDGSTSLLSKCEKLSLSTNMIERISNFNNLKCLRVLSIGRNYVKSLAGIVSSHYQNEACADTLEEIWASYNQIEKISKGTTACKKLKILYLANNWIRDWSEVARLNELTELEDIILLGNPIEEKIMNNGGSISDWQKEVAKRISSVRKIDGYTILRTEEEKEDLGTNSYEI